MGLDHLDWIINLYNPKSPGIFRTLGLGYNHPTLSYSREAALWAFKKKNKLMSGIQKENIYITFEIFN